MFPTRVMYLHATTLYGGNYMARETEKDMLTVSIPRSALTDSQLEKLKALIKSKESLIRKALNAGRLDVTVEDEKISFPWFEVIENGMSFYSEFITALCSTARKLQRVNSKEEKHVENEKYAFRCFLLRIGLIGEQYRETRKVLLKNLSGSAAFRTLPRKEVNG